MSNRIEVTMNKVTYKALTHALHAIGFTPTSGKPHTDEVDFAWRGARKDLEEHGVCTVERNNQTYTIALRQ
jgi:hypothetical protein